MQKDKSKSMVKHQLPSLTYNLKKKKKLKLKCLIKDNAKGLTKYKFVKLRINIFGLLKINT